MPTTSLQELRLRAERYRRQAAEAREQLRAASGSAHDQLTSMTVDPVGQPVSIEFSSELAQVPPIRWSQSVLAVYQAANEAVADLDEPAVSPLRPEVAERASHLAVRDHLVPSFTRVSQADGVSVELDQSLQPQAVNAGREALDAGPDAVADRLLTAWRSAVDAVRAELDHTLDEELR